MRANHMILTIVIFSTLLFVIPIQTSNVSLIMTNNCQGTPSAVDILEMISDPDFNSEPDIYINGTSGEFESYFQPNVVQFNWTHRAGTEIEFNAYDGTTIPQCNDFAYLTQSFDWPYNEKPGNAEIYVNYTTTRTGDFQSGDGSLMFDVLTWSIDSSGNWRRIPSSRDSLRYLSYWDIDASFGGMIEDATGVQEDPTDTLMVGIGLVPSVEFLLYDGSEPWQTYNGSVLVNVTSMQFYTVVDAEPDPVTHLTPLYNETYGSIVGDVYYAPGTDPNSQLWDRLFGKTTDQSGNVYITGYTFTPYELYIETGVRQGHQFLVKYSPTLNERWIARNSNQTRGIAVTVHDDNIYTTGYIEYEPSTYRDLMLTKWTTSGVKVWQREWGFTYDQVGVAVGLDSDESIYVMASDSNMIAGDVGDFYQNSSLLKFDSSGSLLWNKTLPVLVTVQDQSGTLKVFESHIFYETVNQFLILDLEGNVVYDSSMEEHRHLTATCDENGTIYTAEQIDYGYKLGLNRLDSEGNITWTRLFEYVYDNGWVDKFLGTCDISLTQDGHILVLGYAEGYDETFFLLKYTDNGTLIQQWSIGTKFREGWPNGGPWILTEVATSGLFYVSMPTITNDVMTQAYVIGDYTIPEDDGFGTFPDATLILALGGGIGVAIIAGVVIFKKKRT